MHKEQLKHRYLKRGNRWMLGSSTPQIVLNVTKQIEIDTQKLNQQNCPIVTVSSYFYISTCSLKVGQKNLKFHFQDLNIGIYCNDSE